MKLLFILLFAGFAYSQTDLPDRGSLKDIQGKTKFYVDADEPARKSIIKALTDKSSSFVVADKPAEAEFFVFYKILSRDEVVREPAPGFIEKGQLDVYIFRDSKKTIVWSTSGYGSGMRPDTPLSLAKNFVKAVKDDLKK